VREIVRDAWWQFRYHEVFFKIKHARLEWTKELIERGGFDVNADRADEDENGDIKATNVQDLVLNALDEIADSVEYHEKGMAIYASNFAFAKSMLVRGKYTEIDIEEIKQEVEKEAKKWVEEAA